MVYVSRLWLPLYCVFGVPLLLSSFGWIACGGEIPFIEENALPFISFSEFGAAGKLAVNAAMMVLFGACHSLLAQKIAQDAMLRVVPIQLLRPLYVIQSTVLFGGMAVLWQPFPQVLWSVPYLSRDWCITCSAVISFAVAILIAIQSPLLRDPLELMGFSHILVSDEQLRHSADPSRDAELFTSGIYSVVRHPLYLAQLISQVCVLHMSLNRVIMFVLFVSYLSVGVPIEERKLISVFGNKYTEYQKQVPAFIPRISDVIAFLKNPVVSKTKSN